MAVDLQYIIDYVGEEFTHEDVRNHVDILIENGYLNNTEEENDLYYPMVNTWDQIKHISNPIQQKIMTLYVVNIKCVFILRQTQSGKSREILEEIISWTNDRITKVIGFIVLDNDLVQADQLRQYSFIYSLGYNIEVFMLSSSEKKTSIVDIQKAIDLYRLDDRRYPMPVVILLSNPKQCTKMMKLLDFIIERRLDNDPNLYYSIIWDEADKTYPLLRDFHHNGKVVRDYSIGLLAENMFRTLFVTATEGSILDDYDEVALSHNREPLIDESDRAHYVNITNSKVNIRPINGQTQNKYANKLLDEEMATDPDDDTKVVPYFKKPIILSDGTLYFRKVLINSDMKVTNMNTLAKKYNQKGYYTLTYNQNSLMLHQENGTTLKFKTKGRAFNKVLYCVYVVYELHDKPLLIIGNKKVDRGTSFHYAPRCHKSIEPHDITFNDIGTAHNNGIDGLIITDMILGKVRNDASKSQKGGRVSGIITQCPQYTDITIWTDKDTANFIHKQCALIDQVTNIPGSTTISQAMSIANENIAPQYNQYEDTRKTVPIEVPLDSDDIDNIKNSRGVNRQRHVRDILMNKEPSFYNEISSHSFKQITIPNPQTSSYKKHIEDPLSAVQRNKPYTIDIRPGDRAFNIINAYIDVPNLRMICIVWNGREL